MKEITRYSNNVLNDLSISLEQSLPIFKAAICKGLKYKDDHLQQMKSIPVLHVIDNVDIFSTIGVRLLLRTYDKLIGAELLCTRSQDWKTRLRAFYKIPQRVYELPNFYSLNILEDLTKALADLPNEFKCLVCDKLKWMPEDFDYKRMLPISNDFDNNLKFNKSEIGHIITIYHELIIKIQLDMRIAKWKSILKNT